ncbi:TolC family protein [Edaphobacter bradus]|uniref:TolC family protein n=1 Tax=Edaphobacter bradus TaxID=2259016 RepID=UPI0021DF51D1|nr:TolC family protein [Edaphobacter bradus]
MTTHAHYRLPGQRWWFTLLLLCCANHYGQAQQPLTWDQVKARFEAANPALKADALGVDELKAQEITAYLRPNPQFNLAVDGTQFPPHKGPYTPVVSTQEQSTFSYLHERQHKRELRLESAVEGTRIGRSLHEDLDRTMIFTLRSAFVQTLQAKAVLDLAKANLDYYDKIIDISRNRLSAGDIAQVDFDRIELLRVQYESEIQTAIVNLRTAKIQLLQLLNDRTPMDQFNVDGPFDFADALRPLDDYRQLALASRPDLQAAIQTIEQSKTNHKLAMANGSTDPTYSVWWTHNPSFNNIGYGDNTLGLSFAIPLRIFDRNQGEKKRTLIDIDRNNQLTEAARAQVFSDVDSSYEQVSSNIALLKPYKQKYLDQATRVRDTITFSYQHGGASLMDFLNAQSDYRVVQLTYAQLIGSYLVAAGQLNLAVGREVIQ